MANKSINWIAIVFVVIAAYAFFTPFSNWVNDLIGIGAPGEAAIAATGAPGEIAATTICIYDGATMTIGPMKRAFKPAYVVTSEYARIFVNDVDKGLKKDGSTMAVTYGDEVEIFYAENSSLYYAAKQSFVVPCTASFSTADSKLDGDMFKIVANSSSSSWKLEYFNDDDGLLNTATNNESIANADSANMEVKITWPADTGLSPYGSVILTCRYNGSIYDELELGSTETTVSDAVTPTFRSNAVSKAGWKMESWAFPGWSVDTAKVLRLNLYIESDDTNNPHQGSGGAGAGVSNITCYLDDEDWYRNTETGEMEFSAEDNDDGDVGYTTTIRRGFAVS